MEEKLRNQLGPLSLLRKLKLTQEGRRPRLKYQRVRIASRLQQRAMKDCRTAQQRIPRAGNKQGRRKPMQVCEQRRKLAVPQVCLADVFTVMPLVWILRRYASGASIHRELLLRIRVRAEVA